MAHTLTAAMTAGRHDAATRTPGRNAPRGGGLDPRVAAYWEGFSLATETAHVQKAREARLRRAMIRGER